ncbi:MAG TPA: CoA-binding protein [Chthonomonas sp.]|uniref:CoA-binding protein n=1 Tax=Chthonomonas sp. TaxID=2282153 RepID=UPI002B4B194F|nr:CoA-binding protein [Chthonomonas sp.]HLI48565.1 CoA-binding protein [Chthonomonas sp.]
MSLRTLAEQVIHKKRFALCGDGTTDEALFQLYRQLKAAGYRVYLVHPQQSELDGDPVYPSLDNIADPLDCVVIATSPEQALEIVRVAGHLKIPYLWLQPGSDSLAALNTARYFGSQAVIGYDLKELLQWRQQSLMAS